VGARGKGSLTRDGGLHLHAMRESKATVGLILLLVGLLGCTQTQRHRSWSSADSWFHPPGDWLRFRQAESLPATNVVEVLPDRLVAAEEQLRDVACVAVSSDRAADLTGQKIEAGAGAALFLVRAVYLSRATGRFSVVPVGRDLLVEHGSLGRSAVPMQRQALVVRLPREPEVVYVSCEMDE
jgi:hypothetical protein